MWSISVMHFVLPIISLANFALADNRILIGYRRVSKNEAKEINERENIFRVPQFDEKASKGLAEIGQGVYLALSLDGYNSRNREDWWCYVEAEEGLFDHVPKVWIPEAKHRRTETEIADYANTFLNRKELTHPGHPTVRMAPLGGSHKNSIQMLIPTEVVQRNTLKTYAYCAQTLRGLKHQKPIPYKEWHNLRNFPTVDGADAGESSKGDKKPKPGRGRGRQ
ncbi:hypothetical protein LZ30DRAFT_699980 [Colletotrichum cereale]|nr:hypothetical protein LZ30DRAFT_699980 [Colletotrichum cereale]